LSDTVDPRQLRRHSGNPRVGDVGAIAESLRVNSQYRPIVVDRPTMTVLAGWHTTAAARALGWTEVEVVWVDVDDELAARIVLADNRTADLGDYDDSELVALLRLAAPDGLEGTGYDGDDLDDLLAGVGVYQPPEVDETGEPEATVTVSVGPIRFKVDRAVLAVWLQALGDDREGEVMSRLGITTRV
jgi:hypothetical protein